jgi:hypothetical protein
VSSNTLTSSAPVESRAIDWGRYALVGLGTVVAAVLANVLVYFVGSAVVGYDPQFIVLANVSATILFTVVPAIAAVLLYAVLLRFTANPVRIFTSIAAVVLVLSLIPDLTYIPTVPGATTGQTVILVLMHIVAAVVIVGMLTSFTRQTR